MGRLGLVLANEGWHRPLLFLRFIEQARKALVKSKEFIDPCEVPALVDLVSSDSSPATLACQMLSALLDGSSDRLGLVFHMHGAASWADFQAWWF